MKKIEKLNKDQEDKLPIYRDKWLNKIFNYELYNTMTFESVKEKMKELYSYCELKEPIVLLMDSPMGCQIAANIFKINNQMLDQVASQVKDKVASQVKDKVDYQVRSQVGSKVDSKVWD